MSGVIDSKGCQWEHCNICGKLVFLQNLGYVKPSKAHKHGRDVCIDCVNKTDHWHKARVSPSANWVAQRS